MPRLVREDDGGLDGGDSVLVVTGSTLAAEHWDRPTAYRVREALVGAMGEAWAGRVIVCSDLWYLNHDRLRSRPTVCVGAPEVNALSAYLADKLSSLYVIDDVLLVQGDLEEGVVSCWGITHDATMRAAAAFVERYLAEFVRAARGR